jgi:hypothetical protein
MHPFIDCLFDFILNAWIGANFEDSNHVIPTACGQQILNEQIEVQAHCKLCVMFASRHQRIS